MLFSSCNLSCGLKAHHFGGFVILNFHTRLLCRGVVDHVAHGQANLNGRSIRKKTPVMNQNSFLVRQQKDLVKHKNSQKHTWNKQKQTQVVMIDGMRFSAPRRRDLVLAGGYSEATTGRQWLKLFRKSPSSCTAPESSQAENTQQKQKPKIFRSFGFRKWKKVTVKIYHYILYLILLKFWLFLES